MMNEHIRRQAEIRNPFDFKFISRLRSIDNLVDANPCVALASPGMLQSGMSRYL